ncbi:MAG: hypothetical protein Q4C12_01640 [Clostridia bacterium]|nr:hypothetical protein [Clostridia bacterium]
MIKNGSIMAGDIETARLADGKIIPVLGELMPLYLQKENDIMGWLSGRAIDSRRTNARLLKKAMRITALCDADVVLRVHAATITDKYWFKEEDSRLCYDDVKFKENVFDKLVLCGDPDSFNNEGDSTPELTNTGSFEKCWRITDGVWWLYKQGNDNERFSELFIYLLGKTLGFNMAYYELEDGYIKSRDFTAGAEVNYEPMHSLVGEDEDYQRSFEILNSLCPGAAKDFVKMIYLDTICFNMDRHTRNYGVLRNTETGEIIGLAPNFDNNIALIARGYPKNIERTNDRLITLFGQFISDNAAAMAYYDEIDRSILTEELLNHLIDQTGFEVDREHIVKFIMSGDAVVCEMASGQEHGLKME